MGDYILHASAAGAKLRAFFASSTETVGEAARIHGTSPLVSAALGRLLTAGAIMGYMQKNEDDLVTLIIRGDGLIGGLVVSAGKDAGVKGYAYNSTAEVPLNAAGKLHVGRGLGFGTLSVIKDIGLKTPVTGQTELVTGEIAEDLTHYFAHSEQVPTAVALGVLIERDLSVKQAGGFIVQLMPGAPEDLAERIEQRLAVLPPVTMLMEQGNSPEDIMRLVLEGLEPSEIERHPVRYHCNCSRGRVLRALAGVGREELAAMLEEDGGANLHCHFCAKDYAFGRAYIEELLRTHSP
ncbi:MAG: Hsp33 family molecular chaperone HslO [Defluviitaleaceae bacterium]|nr:Hsp33 family molecular chaperone HslO [Defluviitaleaceae bacterium]